MADVITLNEITALGNNLGESVDNLSQKLDSSMSLTQEVKSIAQTAASREVVVDYVSVSNNNFGEKNDAYISNGEFSYTTSYQTVLELSDIVFVSVDASVGEMEIRIEIDSSTTARLTINGKQRVLENDTSKAKDFYLYVPTWTKIKSFRFEVKASSSKKGSFYMSERVDIGTSSHMYYVNW